MSGKYKDKAAAIVFFALAAALYAGTFSMNVRFTSDVGPAFFPKIIAACLAVLSVCLFFTKSGDAQARGTARQGGKSMSVKDRLPFPRRLAAFIEGNKAAFTFVLLVIYAAVIKPLGFILSSAGYLFCQIMLMESARTLKKTLFYLLFSAAVSVCLYFLFASLLHLVLPAGILG